MKARSVDRTWNGRAQPPQKKVLHHVETVEFVRIYSVIRYIAQPPETWYRPNLTKRMLGRN